MGRSAKKELLTEAIRSQVGQSQGPSQSLLSQGQSQGPSHSKENITWAGTLHTRLIFQMKEEHYERWKPGRKVACGKTWAKALSIDHLDKDGTK